MKDIIPADLIEKKIFLIRGQKVMLDSDLAGLYGTTTKALNQAVKRNRDRFPGDFMFQLTKNEKQEVVTICDHLPRLKFSPYAGAGAEGEEDRVHQGEQGSVSSEQEAVNYYRLPIASATGPRRVTASFFCRFSSAFTVSFLVMLYSEHHNA
jgi:hypothetical protein